MMKYTLIFALLFISAVSPAQKNNGKKKPMQAKGVHGTITEGAGSTVYLIRTLNKVQTRIDSAVVMEDGTFHLVPHEPLPFDYYNLLFNDQAVMLMTDSTEIINMQAKAVSFRSSATWSGSPQTEMLQGLINELDPIVAEQQSFIKLANDPNVEAEARMDAKTKYNNSAMAAAARLKEWIMEHESQPAALVALMSLQAGTELALYKNELALLEAKVSHTELYGLVKGEAEKAEKMLLQSAQQGGQSPVIATGAIAPDIQLSDPEGNIRKLSDLRGKVVLIDFWASWCGPCRHENPNVVKAYEEYAADGFEVFSVSLDNDQAKWIQAIAKDKLIWPNHVSDLKGWSSIAASDYGVRSIPFPVLIGREGKVLTFSNDARGPLLEATLKQIFGH